MSNFHHAASFIALLRDHGHGRVTIDRDGRAVPRYALTDRLDLHNARRAIEAQTRLHAAAGANQILAAADHDAPAWARSEDLEAFIARAQGIPLRAGGGKLFSPHQMGRDPRTSVADAWGQLHDIAGV